MRILNLYAGLGGNRKLWPGEHSVSAVEHNSEIAEIYKKFFPNDKVAVADAHKYLLKHFMDYDFIWASPPCQSHSRMGYLAMKHFIKNGKVARAKELTYPDMALYQEIIFLRTFAKCKWVIENTPSYYAPLIEPQKVGKHFFWANFHIAPFKVRSRGMANKAQTLKVKQSIKGFDLTGLKTGIRKDQLLNNCVEPVLGLHIFNCAFNKTEVCPHSSHS